MNVKEGVTRIAKLISATSWTALALGVVLALFNISSPDKFLSIAVLIAGVIGWAVLQGVVWIFDGFVGNTSETSALLWPYKKKAKRTAAATTASVVKSQNLVGVRGWLLFFCLTLMIFSPLFTIGDTAKNVAEAERAFPGLVNLEEWKHYTLCAWAVAWLYSGSFAFAGYRLYNRFYQSSVSIAIRIIWLAPLALMGADMWAAHYFLEIRLEDYINVESLTALLRGLAYATVWTLYLKFSRRVKNTYHLHPPGSPRPPRQEPAL